MSAGRLLGGRYQVGELLGYGGMAEVHHGRDLRLGRDVAIKMLRADLARDATFQMRFGREAQNAAALNHPAIVAVYDTGEERGPSGESLPYIVMEFVNGRTLKEVLTAEGPLMPRRALEVTADICTALEFSHRHGIIHRDIKPGNVMLTRTGQVKVMDFGIARALASGVSTMTQTSAVIGTAQYLSPEQARGEPVDARSDVYATGCVIYELITGRPPFIGDNPVSVAYQHVREDPKAPSETNRDIPPEIDAIVLKALSKNPLNRYQSALDMRNDLLRAAAGRPVLATPVMRQDPTAIVETPMRGGPGGPRATTPARVGDPRRRKQANWGMVTLAILGVLAVIALGTGLYLTNRDQTVQVPDVTGQTVAAATTSLRQHNLTVDPTPLKIHNNTCTVGQVTQTRPAANSVVNKNTTVALSVCDGPGSTQVPPMVGLTKAGAQQLLTSEGLKANFIPTDSDQPLDQVIGVSPDPGTQVNVGDTVDVQVSKFNQAKVPDVVGRTRDDAISLLTGAGFKYTVRDNDAAPPEMYGKVTKVNPDAFTTQLKTTKIIIYVGTNQGVTATPSNTPSVTPSSSPS